MKEKVKIVGFCSKCVADEHAWITEIPVSYLESLGYYKEPKSPSYQELLNNIEHYKAEIEDLEFELACSNRTVEKVIEREQQLENRVKELEQGIAKSMLGCEFLPECTKEREKET